MGSVIGSFAEREAHLQERRSDSTSLSPPESISELENLEKLCDVVRLACGVRISPSALVDGVRFPQGDAEVSEPGLRPIYEDFPAWLGGMNQEEAGLAVTLATLA